MLVPYNAVTGRPYQGKNVEILTSAASKLNVANDPRWLTFLQAKELGYKVKKGAHGTKIEFWNFKDVEVEKENGEKKMKTQALSRHYIVFHASQIEGFQEVQPC